MQPFSLSAFGTALTAASLLAIKAMRSRSLSRSGAVAGFAVGFALVSTGWRGMVLFCFYQLGSMATKYKHAVKAQRDATVATASQRGAAQVLSVSIVATVLSLWHAVFYGAEQVIDLTVAPVPSRLTCAILAHHATCLADTLASELGMVTSVSFFGTNHKNAPILITQPWKRVPIGTNGGVTLMGTLWSVVGGALMGGATVVVDLFLSHLPLSRSVASRMVLFGSLCGFLGSLIDSILGATIQVTYWDEESKLVGHSDRRSPQQRQQPHVRRICGADILTNEQVNLASVVIMTFLGGWIIAPLVFS